MSAQEQVVKPNWCRKLNSDITPFLVNVMCIEPKLEGCASCSESANKHVVFVNCGEMKTAYDCLGTHTGKRCDYAEAWEGAFFCNKPKGSLPIGKVTIIESIINSKRGLKLGN